MTNFHVVAANLVEQEGKYLLVQEGKESVRGEWNLPAGGVDSDEKIKKAAVREAKEETGLEVKPDRFLGVFVDESDMSDANVLVFVFKTKAEKLNPEIPESDEIMDVAFFKPEEFHELDIRIPFLDEIIKKSESGRFMPLNSVQDFR